MCLDAVPADLETDEVRVLLQAAAVFNGEQRCDPGWVPWVVLFPTLWGLSRLLKFPLECFKGPFCAIQLSSLWGLRCPVPTLWADIN